MLRGALGDLVRIEQNAKSLWQDLHSITAIFVRKTRWPSFTGKGALRGLVRYEGGGAQDQTGAAKWSCSI